MEILPAIDISEGKAVRLEKGDFSRRTEYADDPVAVADKFCSLGAKWIHVVNLDAARTGSLEQNFDIVRKICTAMNSAGVRVEYGGGVRDTASVEVVRACGVDRMVIGSAAVKDWEWFEGLLANDDFPNEMFALGLDCRGGFLAAEGWTEQTQKTAVEFSESVSGSGLGAIVYTDIARDGMLSGVNIDATEDVIRSTDVPVIASGGVASIDDVSACKKIGCRGVIIGKAYYAGKIDLEEAFKIAR